jgi:hypothetical protein
MIKDNLEGGVEVGQLAHGLRPGLPVLYTTGCAAGTDIKKSFVQPSAYLQKPYTGKELTKAVSQLLQAA